MGRQARLSPSFFSRISGVMLPTLTGPVVMAGGALLATLPNTAHIATALNTVLMVPSLCQDVSTQSLALRVAVVIGRLLRRCFVAMPFNSPVALVIPAKESIHVGVAPSAVARRGSSSSSGTTARHAHGSN